MIRKLFKSVRQRDQVSHEIDNSPPSISMQVESLEDRIMLSWVGFFDGITLDLVQTGDHGDVVIDNSGVGGAFRVIDNADTLTFVDARNVTVTMLDNTANQLNFNINTTHTGDVEIDLGHGPRDVVFSGTIIPGIANTVGGNMTVLGGDGPQVINLAPITFVPVPFETVGNATFDLGDGFDTVYNNENFVIIGGDLNLIGVNLFRYTDFLFPVPLDADLKVGGNLTMDTSNESTESFLIEGGTFHDADPDVNERSIIFGDFNYIGGDDIDHVNLNDTYIVGNVTIDLGEGIPFFGDPQNVTTTLTAPLIFGGPTAQIDGNISITAGDSNLGNVITLNGEFRGDTVEFFMGGLEDSITYALLGTQADITAFMGSGDDTFTLNVGVNVLDIDFGNDIGDIFVNNWGQFTFDSDLTNFHWFDHLYTVGDDTLVMNQLMDTGDIIIDNDGGPGAFGIDWRLFTALGGVGSSTPAANFILNMLDNTGDVELDLFNPVLAFLTLNLGDGDRTVDFTGASNNPLRDINITADVGDQIVNLSVNSPLAVATLNVNLGIGFDLVDDNANNLIVSEDFIFSGVNYFENDGILSVARHAFISSNGEMEDTLFANNSTMFVGALFTYAGGAAADEVRLNGSGSNVFTRTVTIDVGDNVTGGTQVVLLDGPNTSIGDTLTVISSSDVHPDLFLLSPSAMLGGNVIVSLADGPNTANIVGQLSGNVVEYTGGIGNDVVTFGTTGNPATADFFLDDGDDTFTLLAGTRITNFPTGGLFVDFGTGDNTFNNLYGPFDFSAILLGLDGFNHTYDLGSDTLTSDQISNPGPVTVDNNGAGGALRFIDGGTNVITTVTNLNINMLNDTDDLTIRLDNALAGDLNIKLRDGDRALKFDGTNNSIGGDLSITGGTDTQLVELAINNDLSVGGSAIINLSTDFDSVDEGGNNIDITGDLNFVGVNEFENNGTTTVGGDFNVNNSGDSVDGLFDDNGTLNVAGNFSYVGGNRVDEVLLNGATTIGGNAFIDVGNNVGPGTQKVWLDSALTSIGGRLDVFASGSTNVDSFKSDAGTVIGDDIKVKLGDGPNTAIILGIFGGSNVTYSGGSGTDTVRLGTTGNPADMNIKLGAGADVFTLNAGTAIDATLRIDFGTGNDSFVNQYGNFMFDTNLLNWHGFSRYYDHAQSTLTMTQLSDTGNITIDNNGANGAIRMLNGATTKMTAADNIRLNLKSNTSSNVSIDYDMPQAGNTILNLKSGDRSVNFIGDSNNIGGFLRIDAGTNGDQVIRLAVNSNLVVDESVVINLRGGVDTVDDGSNDLNVGTNLIFRSVNVFRNDNSLTVGGNMTMNTRFDNVNSVLDNNSVINLGGNFTYIGGSGADNVFMNGATIGGNANVDLGTGNNSQTVDFSGASMARMLVLAGDTIGGNFVRTSGTTFVDGDVVMRFDSSNAVNNVLLQGVYTGTYGSYRGGSAMDIVTFGASAANMAFGTLLKNGNDIYTLNSGSNLLSGVIDFGNGNDTFNDNIGAPYPFPLTIKNLP